jgi:hypothetical protein
MPLVGNGGLLIRAGVSHVSFGRGRGVGVSDKADSCCCGQSQGSAIWSSGTLLWPPARMTLERR